MSDTPFIVGPGQRLQEIHGERCLLFGARGCMFSNFRMFTTPMPVRYDRLECVGEVRSVEHYFQAQKALNIDDFRRVLAVNGPQDARREGKKIPYRQDWEAPNGTIEGQRVSVRAEAMWNALQLKYSIEKFRDLLLSTDSLVLIENAPWDPYWGAGKDGRGTNALGRMLMCVRDQLTDTPIDFTRTTPPVPR